MYSIKNILYELLDMLTNDLRHKILGNSEIVGKPQNWLETELCA